MAERRQAGVNDENTTEYVEVNRICISSSCNCFSQVSQCVYGCDGSYQWNRQGRLERGCGGPGGLRARVSKSRLIG